MWFRKLVSTKFRSCLQFVRFTSTFITSCFYNNRQQVALSDSCRCRFVLFYDHYPKYKLSASNRFRKINVFREMTLSGRVTNFKNARLILIRYSTIQNTKHCNTGNSNILLTAKKNNFFLKNSN